MKDKRVYPAIALAITAISFASIFIKSLELHSVPPLVIASYRMLFAVILLAPWMLIHHRKELAKLERRDWLLMALSGTCLAIHFGAWTFSFKYISIARSTVIVDSQPVFTVIASYLLLREKPSRWSLIGTVLAIAGIVTITLLGDENAVVDKTGGGSARLGDLLALIGAVSIAFYVLIGRKLRGKVSLFAYVVPLYTICAVLLFAAAYFNGDRITGYPFGDYKYFVALAVVPTIFGHTVFNWALKHVKAGVISVSFLGEPIGATLLAIVFFRQIPSISTVLCGLLILAGIYMTTISESEAK